MQGAIRTGLRCCHGLAQNSRVGLSPAAVTVQFSVLPIWEILGLLQNLNHHDKFWLDRDLTENQVVEC